MLYDKDIREPLFEYLETRYGRVRILEEKIMGISRADVVMITENAFVGIEIKSDADTYTRLPRQIRDYDYFFDANIIAVGSTHAAHIAEHVPEWWGIITVDEVEGMPDFYMLREPGVNPLMDVRLKLSLLWRPELARIQAKHEMAAYKRMSKKFVIGKISDQVPYELLRYDMSAELMERDYTTISEEINRFRVEEEHKPRRRSAGTGTRKIRGLGNARKRSGRSRKDGPDLMVKKVVRHSRRQKSENSSKKT